MARCLMLGTIELHRDPISKVLSKCSPVLPSASKWGWEARATEAASRKAWNVDGDVGDGEGGDDGGVMTSLVTPDQ